MSCSIFDTLIERVMPHEGGYLSPEEAKRQGDPGGETKFGISKRAYPNVNIKDLTRQQAIELYRKDYWNDIQGDSLPPAVAYAMLDAAINSGETRAIMWLQRAAGVAEDGKYGPVSKAAVAVANPADLMLKIMAYRLDFMTRLSNWSINSKGWARRIAAVLLYGAEDN